MDEDLLLVVAAVFLCVPGFVDVVGVVCDRTKEHTRATVLAAPNVLFSHVARRFIANKIPQHPPQRVSKKGDPVEIACQRKPGDPGTDIIPEAGSRCQ